MKKAKMVSKSTKTTSKKTKGDDTPFDRFADLTKRIVRVPKTEIKSAEAKRQKRTKPA